MDQSLRILLVDEDPAAGTLVQQGLQREFENVEVKQVTTLDEFERALESHFDFAVTALRLSWADGPTVSARLKARDSDMQVILLLTHGDEDKVIDAVKAGLDGYVFKSGNYVGRLSAAIGLAFERRVQRRAAREVEAQLHTLFDRVPVGLYRITPEGQILEANPALASIAGCPDRDTLMAHSIVDFFISQENFDRWRADVEGQGTVHDYQGPGRRFDGSLMWVRNSARAVRDSDGNLIYYEGAIEDITERRRVEEESQRGKTLMEKTLDSMPGVFYLFDENGRYLRWNHNLERVTGYSAEEIAGMHPIDVVDPADVKRVSQKIAEVFRTGAAEVEAHLLSKDGTRTLYHFTGQRIELDGKSCLIGTGVDISERKRAEDEIRLLQTITLTMSEETNDLNSALEVVLRKVCDATGWLVGEAWLPNADNTFVEFSGAAYTAASELDEFVSHCREYRFRPNEPLIGKVWTSKQAIWVGDLSKETGAQRALIAKEAGLKAVMAFPVLAGQTVVAVLCFLARETQPEDQRLINMVSGVAAQLGLAIQRKHAEARVHYLVHFDRLTGLPNRTLFADRTQQAIIEAGRHQRSVGVMFVDLDRFKNINDSLGHNAGDQLVKGVAERLSGVVRSGDTVARLSGDLFAIAFADMGHADDAARLARKVLDTFIQPFQIGGHEIYITASLGITMYPVDDQDVHGLLRNADVAMHRAKESGRNTFQFYSSDMASRAAENLTLENDLRHAIERGELVLHYQPLVESKNGRTMGAEALVRWNHGKRGMIPPMQFIPLAEESGLIISIGEWVLRNACRQCQEWRRNGFTDIRIAVNLSARQFQQEGLDRVVIGILEETGLDPVALELELTESMIMQSSSETLLVMQRLADLGVTFSIDDFGTGYSNLSYLKRFPVDTLKVDRSFVKDIPDDADDSAIAQAIITMAHSLGMQVVAEGVETEQQSVFLRAYGCDVMQGYYFSKPLPASEIVLRLEHERQVPKRA